MESGLRDPDGLIGTMVGGKYRVIDVVARGGMGRIYRAEQVPLGRPVALKVLHSELGETGDTGFQKRFLLEAASCARLTHPNIVVVYDYGRVEESARETYFIAMELLEGRTLGQIMRDEGPMPPAVALRIAREVARALREAHRQGMVHRDLKPSNVMIATSSEGDHVKVLDFGLVKVAQDDSEELTKEGHFLGSPKYMAPEQIRRGPVDGRADLYSLGILLYQMLSGVLPFEGEQPVQTLMAHLTEAVPLLPPSVPHEIAALVYRSLEKDPDHRWSSASEFISAVDHAGHSMGWSGVTDQMSGETTMHTGAFQVSNSSPGSVPGVRPLNQSSHSGESSLGGYYGGGHGGAGSSGGSAHGGPARGGAGYAASGYQGGYGALGDNGSSLTSRASLPPTRVAAHSWGAPPSVSPHDSAAPSTAPRRRGGYGIALLVVLVAAFAGGLSALYGSGGTSSIDPARSASGRSTASRDGESQPAEPAGTISRAAGQPSSAAGGVLSAESTPAEQSGSTAHTRSAGGSTANDRAAAGAPGAGSAVGTPAASDGAQFMMFVQSAPAGAVLRRSDRAEPLGRTPTYVEFSRGELERRTVTFRLELPGYAPYVWTQGTSPTDVHVDASLERVHRVVRTRRPNEAETQVPSPPTAEPHPRVDMIKTRR